MWKYFKLISLGQYLTDAMHNVYSGLQDWKMVNYEQVTEDNRNDRELDLLLDRFKRPAALRPKDTYNLNGSTGLGVESLIITYIIILMQFKATE